MLGSLLMSWVRSRWVSPRASPSRSVRITVNWSGVMPKWVMRRRKAWFKPYQARRSNGGSRRRPGESRGGAAALGFGPGTINLNVANR